MQALGFFTDFSLIKLLYRRFGTNTYCMCGL
jgi:hypothetical protein